MPAQTKRNAASIHSSTDTMTATSNSIKNSMVDYLAVLLGFIETRDWTNFEAFVLQKQRTFRQISRKISKHTDFNGLTLLHACARYSPPIHIVAKMIEFYPDLTRARDCLGRTPLHIAAANGASPSLVELLVSSNPSACDIQDEDGRTPLHFASDSSCELFDTDTNESRGLPSHGVIRALLSNSLQVVTLEDKDGISALEYAVISNAPVNVVELLQMATQLQLMPQRLIPVTVPCTLSKQKQRAFIAEVSRTLIHQ